jgi:hypothetical protein
METAADTFAPPAGAAAAWSALEALAASTLPPKEYWARFAVCLRETLSSAVVLALHRAAPSQPWRVIASAVDGPAARKLSGEEFVKAAPSFADAITACGEFPRQVSFVDGREVLVAAAAIPSRRGQEQAALVSLHAPSVDAASIDARLRAAAFIPAASEARAAIERAEAESRRLTGVLDTVVQANAEEKFGAAAIALCNAIAAQFGCDRVSLGWHHAGYTKLAAINQHEQVDRKRVTPQLIEAAMDECLDQDEAITVPAPGDVSFVSRDHQKLAAATEGAHVLSVPLHHGDKAVAVLTCERAGSAFTAEDVPAIRLACDQITPRLTLLRGRDRWFGARLMDSLRRSAAGLLGPKHTLAKLAALLVALALGVLVFWHTEYRVEGNFLLRSEKMANMTSPIEGFIKEVLVESSDKVAAGQVLMRLNTDQLKVEESAAIAEVDRYTREEEKARAANAVADMQIAATLSRQSRARLEAVRFRLAQSEIKSPIDGVVIEGDHKERLDSPLKQGDPIFRIAQLPGYYIDIQVDERDAQEILHGAVGECAFLTDPKTKLPVKVDRVLPAAVEKDGVAVFSVRAQIDTPEAEWWRPGMSGVAKINAGEKSLLWIVSHRTVDFLRMKLWW